MAEEVEELEKPVIEEDAPEPQPEPEPDGGDPAARRLKAELEEERAARTRLQAQLDEMSARNRTGRENDKPADETFDEEKDRKLFDQDPYAWHRHQLQALEQRRARENDQSETVRILEASPYSKLTGEAKKQFDQRLGDILDELYPGDWKGEKVPLRVQYRAGLKMYGKMYGDKARDEIRETVPATGKGARQAGSGPVTKVTVSMLEEAHRDWWKPPLKGGKGIGQQRYEDWQAKGLLNDMPEEE